MATVVAPSVLVDSMGVSRTETKVFWDTTDQEGVMNVDAAPAARSSHMALWWAIETRTDIVASSVALGVGLASLGLLILF